MCITNGQYLGGWWGKYVVTEKRERRCNASARGAMKWTWWLCHLGVACEMGVGVAFRVGWIVWHGNRGMRWKASPFLIVVVYWVLSYALHITKRRTVWRLTVIKGIQLLWLACNREKRNPITPPNNNDIRIELLHSVYASVLVLMCNNPIHWRNYRGVFGKG